VKERRNDLVVAIDEELKHIARAGAVTVVVAAEVSRGKSLLVNALVGKEDLLPVDIDVSTGVYALVRYSKTAAARVHTRSSNQPIAVDVDHAGDWISVARNPRNAKDVKYVEVDFPAPLLGRGLSFIDTPGVGGLDAVHGATTLAALSDADALIFVLDAAAPVSRPELNFLVKAAQRIQSVILVLTKTDVFPGWQSILDENRQLFRKFAPRFAEQQIIPVRSPLFFEAMKRRAAGDSAAADRFLERSGIPVLRRRLREGVLRRSTSLRIANGHRLAVSALSQLEAGYKAQLATLNGDTSPLRALQERQKDLAQQKGSVEGWRQGVTRDFNDINAQLTRDLQETMAEFRAKYDSEIATSWRSGKHLSFPAELEADLHLAEMKLQRHLAESLLECAGTQVARHKVEDFSAATAVLSMPERSRLDARDVGGGKSQLMTLGSGLLSGAVGILGAVLYFNPLYAVSGVLGFATTLRFMRRQRAAAEQAEARRLLLAYAERFQRDCKSAIDQAVRSAADTTTEALQARIQGQLAALQVQIQDLTKKAGQVKEIQAARTSVASKRALVAKLDAENRAAFRAVMSAPPRMPPAGAGRPRVASPGAQQGIARSGGSDGRLSGGG
jgi:hypothetical protein